MAVRPVFVPTESGRFLVNEIPIEFEWSPGFAEVQKKNVKALHEAAIGRGLGPLLEISSKSEIEVGRRLSAFSLKLEIGGERYGLESVYQGSKVFERCGQREDIFRMTPREAKHAVREMDWGQLIAFELEGVRYPLSPKSAFYDWLYIRAIAPHFDWIERKIGYKAFTDIEFNPARQVNCQARAFAEFLSLLRLNKLSEAVSDFGFFASLLKPI